MTAPAERFAAALARVLPEGGRIGLAVSGGADSTAMLVLANEVIPGQFEVATVDHGLRVEAAAECAGVAQLCASLGVSCAVLCVSVPSGNVQSQARFARYAALAGWAAERGLNAIATAHQADDQAETLMLRLARGSGVAGLAGIRERGTAPGSAVPLIRPMLHFTRAECEAVATNAGIDWVRDPSNENERFDRVRMRKLLAAMPLGTPQAVLATAANCADADAALDWAALREWDERVRETEHAISYAPQAPRAIAIRIVERAVKQLGGSIRGGQAADVVDALISGGGQNAGGVLARSIGGEWVFTPEPQRLT